MAEIGSYDSIGLHAPSSVLMVKPILLECSDFSPFVIEANGPVRMPVGPVQRKLTTPQKSVPVFSPRFPSWLEQNSRLPHLKLCRFRSVSPTVHALPVNLMARVTNRRSLALVCPFPFVVAVDPRRQQRNHCVPGRRYYASRPDASPRSHPHPRWRL